MSMSKVRRWLRSPVAETSIRNVHWWCIKLVCRRIFCLLAPVLLVGCFQVNRGLYDASDVASGWSAHQSEGITSFTRPIPKKPRWFISTSSRNKGELYFNLGCTDWDPDPFFYSVTFSDDQIHIVLHDKNEQEMIDGGIDFVTYHAQTLYVGDSGDFTVILPPFKIRDINIPEFSARFKWSDRKYLEWIPVQ